MNALTAWLASLLTPIITAAVTAAVKEAFAAMQDKAVIGKPNDALQDDWHSGDGSTH